MLNTGHEGSDYRSIIHCVRYWGGTESRLDGTEESCQAEQEMKVRSTGSSVHGKVLVGRLWNDMQGAESRSYGERFWSRSFKPPLPSFPRLLLEHENKNNTSALTRIWNQLVPKKAGAPVPAAFSQRHAWFFLSTHRSLFDCRCLIDVGLNGSES